MDEEYPDPLTCPYRTGKTVGEHCECTYSGKSVWVSCSVSICGEPPVCSYAPVDNSPEAMARRVGWMRESEVTP
jgi:hypothetical protein